LPARPCSPRFAAFTTPTASVASGSCSRSGRLGATCLAGLGPSAPRSAGGRNARYKTVVAAGGPSSWHPRPTRSFRPGATGACCRHSQATPAGGSSRRNSTTSRWLESGRHRSSARIARSRAGRDRQVLEARDLWPRARATLRPLRPCCSARLHVRTPSASSGDAQGSETDAGLPGEIGPGVPRCIDARSGVDRFPRRSCAAGPETSLIVVACLPTCSTEVVRIVGFLDGGGRARRASSAPDRAGATGAAPSSLTAPFCAGPLVFWGLPIAALASGRGPPRDRNTGAGRWSGIANSNRRDVSGFNPASAGDAEPRARAAVLSASSGVVAMGARWRSASAVAGGNPSGLVGVRMRTLSCSVGLVLPTARASSATGVLRSIEASVAAPPAAGLMSSKMCRSSRQLSLAAKEQRSPAGADGW